MKLISSNTMPDTRVQVGRQHASERLTCRSLSPANHTSEGQKSGVGVLLDICTFLNMNVMLAAQGFHQSTQAGNSQPPCKVNIHKTISEHGKTCSSAVVMVCPLTIISKRLCSCTRSLNYQSIFSYQCQMSQLLFVEMTQHKRVQSIVYSPILSAVNFNSMYNSIFCLTGLAFFVFCLLTLCYLCLICNIHLYILVIFTNCV